MTDETLDEDQPLLSDATPTRLLWARLAMGGYPTGLSDVLGSLGSTSLASQSRIWSGTQLPLPKNQWQLDVLQWWHIVLAATQASWLVPPLFSFRNELLFC